MTEGETKDTSEAIIEETVDGATEDTIEETGITIAMAVGIDVVGLAGNLLFPLWLLGRSLSPCRQDIRP
jgi:hypothetical protein